MDAAAAYAELRANLSPWTATIPKSERVKSAADNGVLLYQRYMSCHPS
jgi:hypothetical protein